MRKTFQYRLKPTASQERQLHATLSACRFVYNWGIEDRKNLWERCGVSTNFFDQSKFLTHLKELQPFLKSVHAHPLQDALKRVAFAYDGFFDRGNGYPRFKGRYLYKSFTFKEWGNGAKFDGKRLELSKIGRVRINLHRPIEGEIKTCTIKRRADGWYALFSAEVSTPWRSINENPALGVDVGILSFAAFSTGDLIDNPRYLIAQERALRVAQRKVSHRTKGSSRRRKAADHLALIHLLISRQRRDFHFKTAKKIVDRSSAVFFEKLNVSGMMKNHCLAKYISDVSWSSFLGILSRSAESAGVAYMAVEAPGTSQECVCGEPVLKDLSVRIHRCPKCGLVEDRDVVSAKIVLARGLGRPVGEDAGCNKRPTTRETAGDLARADCHVLFQRVLSANL
jgi:putative transposase